MPVVQYGIRNSVFGMINVVVTRGQGGLGGSPQMADIIVRTRIDSRTKLSDIRSSAWEWTREIASLRKSETRPVPWASVFGLITARAKAAMPWCMSATNSQIDPKTARKIREQLGLAD